MRYIPGSARSRPDPEPDPADERDEALEALERLQRELSVFTIPSGKIMVMSGQLPPTSASLLREQEGIWQARGVRLSFPTGP